MLVRAIVDSVHYFGEKKDRTQVTLRFPSEENDPRPFLAGMWTFEYAGKPLASHHVEAELKLDLTGGDELKQAAFMKISELLPAVVKKFTRTPEPAIQNLDPIALYKSLLGSLTEEQLHELEMQILEEKSRR